MAAPEALVTVSSVVSFLLQGAGLCIGWAVVHRLSAARDRDKARRELLVKSADSLSEAADKLLLLARDYHLKERDVGKELSIKMLLQDLSLRTGALSDICKDDAVLASCRTAIQAMRRSISGRHFEDEHTAPLEEGVEQLEAIAADVIRVKHAALKLKHRQFPIEG